MNLFPSHITINSTATEVKTLLKSNAQQDWQKEMLDFIAEWYNTNDFITVQTSGSTGTPKSLTLKKDFVAASAFRTIRFFDLQKGDKILHCLPCRYIAGKLMIVRALLAELDLHIVEPSVDFEKLQNTSFKFAAMVVNQVQKYVTEENQNIEKLLLGGSAIPAPLEIKLQNIPTQCYSSYAMTETATHIALRQLNGKNKSQYYTCLDNIKVSLSENNCIKIEMPGLPQGDIQTNDIGELKNSKTFKVLGRIDNVIVSGGIKFSPEKIEKKLENYIPVTFAITSTPDNRLGEKIILVIEQENTSELMRAYETICKKQLPKYEQPKNIAFVKKIPETGNGKISRSELKRNISNFKGF